MASALDAILAKYTAAGDDTKDKLLGAAFVVVNKDGETVPCPRTEPNYPGKF